MPLPNCTSLLCGATTDLVEEVEQERGVPRFRVLVGFRWQQCHDARTIWCQVECSGADDSKVSQSAVGPYSRLIADERVALHGIRRDHDSIVLGAEEQLASIARPHRICPVADEPPVAAIGERAYVDLKHA